MSKVVFTYIISVAIALQSIASQSIDPDLTRQVSVKDTLALEILRTLYDSSTTNYYNGSFNKSFRFNLELLENAKEQKNLMYIQLAHAALGYDYLIQNDSINAHHNFLQAQDLAKETRDTVSLAYSYLDMANLYYDKDDNQSIALYEKSIALFESLGDTLSMGKVYFDYLEASMRKKKYLKSTLIVSKIDALLPYMRKSEDSLYHIAYRPLAALLYNELQDYEMALYYLQPNLAEAPQYNLPVDLEYTYEEYSRAIEGLGDIEGALIYRKKYDSIRNLNFSREKSIETAKIQALLDVARFKEEAKNSERELQLQSQIVDSQNRINILLIVISLVFLGFLLYFYSTSRKRKELVKKIQIQNSEYLSAKKEAERLAQVKTNFFSTVSHELRTPLYGVIGLSSLLLEDESLKSHKKDLKTLKFSANYLLRLINDVLQINKIDSNNLEESYEEFELKSLLETLSLSFEYIRIQNNNRIGITISDEVPSHLLGNSVMLSQILMNLVGNAAKFTENGSITIEVALEKEEGKTKHLKFAVTDTGIGIAKEKQKNIFQEFSQANAINTDYQGSGLGLAIVSKLLNTVQSKIEFKSVLGEGSSFYFTLPFEEVKNASSNKIKSLNPFYAKALLKNKEILIVDDNKINRTITEKILEREGVLSDLARNGKEAVDLALAKTYDLILMDVHMPIMDGLEATKKIREFNNFTPIVALTAVEVDEMRSKIFGSGMNDIIVKPYDIQKFKMTIIQNFKAKSVTI